MTLKEWLVMFVLSMAISAEVLVWAISHGQFEHINRGNSMPLRPGATVAPKSSPRRRPWAVAAIFAGLAVMLLVWLNGMVQLALAALGRFGPVKFPY